MGPILAAIGKFCAFREEHTAGHHMMSFLQLKPATMSLRDIAQFVRVLEDRLQSTPGRFQPPADMLFAHLWNDPPGGCGFRTWTHISEDARDIVKSSRRSQLRTFAHLLKCIKAALSLKREAWNLASVQKSLASAGSPSTRRPDYSSKGNSSELRNSSDQVARRSPQLRMAEGRARSLKEFPRTPFPCSSRVP